jgi:hypothetical protein
MYLNNMKNNSNAVDKPFCAVITGMKTYTIYMQLQKYIHYRREDPADNAALPKLPDFPNFLTSLTLQIFRLP